MLKQVRIILIILLLGFIYFSTPNYVKKSIIYLFPGIEDYTIFANREVEAGKYKPWYIAKDYMQHTLQPNERDTLELYESVAYIIIQNDSIIYEEYWDDYNENSLSNSFSASKSIVSLLIGAAIQDGLIKDVNEPVTNYIPEFNNTAYNKLCIKDLLTMSSGLNWKESYSNPFSMTTEAYYGDHINELALSLKPIEVPGVEFKYLSGNTQLLAIIVENATKKTLSEYCSEKIWKPLGAKHTALWSLDKENGNEKAYCCLNSNARDFARIGKIIMNKGKINGVQIFPESFISESITPAHYLIDSQTKQPVDFYGYQWWLIQSGRDTIPYARGIYGQYIFVLEKENAIVVRLGHKRSSQKVNHHPSETYTYINTAKRILADR